jgi:hypothetical protein
MELLVSHWKLNNTEFTVVDGEYRLQKFIYFTQKIKEFGEFSNVFMGIDEEFNKIITNFDYCVCIKANVDNIIIRVHVLIRFMKNLLSINIENYYNFNFIKNMLDFITYNTKMYYVYNMSISYDILKLSVEYGKYNVNISQNNVLINNCAQTVLETDNFEEFVNYFDKNISYYKKCDEIKIALK